MPLGMRSMATMPKAVSRLVVSTISPKYGLARATRLMPPAAGA